MYVYVHLRCVNRAESYCHRFVQTRNGNKIGMCRATERLRISNVSRRLQRIFCEGLIHVDLGSTRVLNAKLYAGADLLIRGSTNRHVQSWMTMTIGNGIVNCRRKRDSTIKQAHFLERTLLICLPRIRIHRTREDKLHGGNGCGDENWFRSTMSDFLSYHNYILIQTYRNTYRNIR